MSFVDRQARVSQRTRRVSAVGSMLSAVVLVLPGQASAVDATAGVISRVSVSTSGVQANNHSTSTSISADGRYVAFDSEASNLVPGDTNGSQDVFVRDRQTGATSRVSVSGAGVQADCCSASPAISADGRYVTFGSSAPDLVPGDTNDAFDVFVRDRLAGTTRRISVSGAAGQANAGSTNYPKGISAAGRYIAFVSTATNLVPGDTNGSDDVFLRDVQTGITRRVSVSGAGAQADGDSSGAAVSANGRYVTFYSSATNLVPGDTNEYFDVFRRDVQTRVTRRVSVSSTGIQGEDGSVDPAISADGRYVAFYSFARNLVPADTNGSPDVFLRDVQTGVTRRISISGTGAQGNGDSYTPAISPDGRYLAFESDASNLVPGDTNATTDVFVRDWGAGVTRRVSVSDSGVQGNKASGSAAIGSDDRQVAFHSWASNLVAGDTNGRFDIFVRVS
jgi:Tol biopolymer transport system component